MSISNKDKIILLKDAYSPDKFVNRDDELRRVETRIAQVRNGAAIQPLINFWGMPGIGKSWLLKHIHHIYTHQSDGVYPLYYDFEPQLEGSSPPSLSDVIRKLAEQLPANLQDEQINDPASFKRAVSSLLPEQVPLILFDTTEKLPDENLHELEKQLLEPLLKSDKVIIVVAGRQKIARWRRVEVRRRVTPAVDTLLGAFHTAAFKQQLSQQSPAMIEEITNLIYAKTAGTPWLVHLIIERIADLDGEINEKSVTAIILSVLAAYEQDEILSTITDETLRIYFDAVLPLRFYRIETLREMLEAQAERPSDLSDVTLLQGLRELDREADFVWWSDRGEYTTDPTVRAVIEQRLLIDNREKFIGQHKQAITLYKNRAEEFKVNSAYYLIEWLYHEALLQKANNRTLTMESSILSTIKKFMRDTKDGLSADNQNLLCNQLEKDDELRQLIPEELFNEFLAELNALALENGGKND